MESWRTKAIQERVAALIEHFPTFLGAFDERQPFSRYGQFEYHDRTIKRRFSHTCVEDAIADDDFLKNLYYTLVAWGVGKGTSVLVPLPEFITAIRDKAASLVRLDGLHIDDADLDAKLVSSELWQLIDSLPIVKNRAKIVPCSKALHHLLPDLVPPIDRTYTCQFFLWSSAEFQNRQEKFLALAFRHFVAIARATHPAQYVGQGWRTSRTKVVNNAIVGYVRLAEKPSEQAQRSS
jgi:hypothetical protein